jgi:hypothetical protein
MSVFSWWTYKGCDSGNKNLNQNKRGYGSDAYKSSLLNKEEKTNIILDKGQFTHVRVDGSNCVFPY